MLTKSGNDEVLLSYLLENTGRYTAEEVIFLSRAPDFASADITPHEVREIAPAAKMKFIPNALPLEITGANASLEFELIVLYKAQIAGENNAYRSSYCFRIEKAQLFSTEHYSVSARHTEGTLSTKQQLELIEYAETLAGPEGTIYFEFEEKEQDPKMPSILASAL